MLLPGQALTPLRAQASRGPRTALCFGHATRAEEKRFPRDSAGFHVTFLPIRTPAPCATSARSPLVLSLPQRLAQPHSPHLFCTDRLPFTCEMPQVKHPAFGTVPLTGLHQHAALPTSSRMNIFSASSFSVVRYCLYSLNSFRVQTT